MQVRDLLCSEVESTRLLLCANGWAHRIESPEWFARLVAASQRTAVAVDSGEVVGFARGITDGLCNGYLSMVVVASHYRGKGVGRSLVKHVLVTTLASPGWCALAARGRMSSSLGPALSRRQQPWSASVVSARRLNLSVNADAQERRRATRAPGLGRRLLLRYASLKHWTTRDA